MKEQFDEKLDIERNWKREQRIREMRKRKEQQNRIRKWIRAGVPVLAGIVILAVVMVVKGTGKTSGGQRGEKEAGANGGTSVSQEVESAENRAGETAGQESGSGAFTDKGWEQVPAGEAQPEGEGQEEVQAPYSAKETEDTLHLGTDLASTYAILIDLDKGNIVAEKNARIRMNPASMTKVLTLLVAAEHIENLEGTFTITLEITDYSFVNGCSNAGFEKDETVTVRDLLYGTILPSGAEAAVGLAVYVAGSQEAFVELMNEKLEELGLAESAHVTNCVGIYDEDHYCTVYDMAMIMEAAMDNELCREVLSARTYTTSETEAHPEGLMLSNWFIRRIEDRDVGGKVLSGKTGFVKESGSCASSYGEDKNGKGYICVSADADSPWICIGDHVQLYRKVMLP